MPHLQLHRYRKPPFLRRTLVHPVSLRVKLLIGFSVVFSVVLAATSVWFYKLTANRMIEHLQADMRLALKGATVGVDTDELLALYREGQRNSAGFSNDPRYRRQLEWFETVQRIQPHFWLYTYAVGFPPDNRRLDQGSTPPNQLEMVYLVDLWASHDPEKAARFLESEPAGVAAHQVFREQTMYESPEIYRDRWGAWLSAAIPLQTADDGTVLVLGLDVESNYVLQLQATIRNQILITATITYGVLIVLIYILSGMLTKRLSQLTSSAQQIGAGDYSLDLSSLTHDPCPDEMSTLAHVFERMVESIRTRERMIREGKQVEYEMRLALQQERELNELKSRFVSMVSHELRTPLTVIRTSLELLEYYHDRLTSEKREQYFQRSRIAIETMTQLLEDVLTLGKAEAGKLEFKPLFFDVDQFCAELVQELQLGEGRDHQILLSTEGQFQPICLDPNLLRSILTNLLSNAVKYSPQGTTIEFLITFQEGKVSFSITDHGIGIPRDDQSRLFTLFHRASNVKMIRGTGLGLAIVKQCVGIHQGQVSFTSVEGEGTTFTVTLPSQLSLGG